MRFLIGLLALALFIANVLIIDAYAIPRDTNNEEAGKLYKRALEAEIVQYQGESDDQSAEPSLNLKHDSISNLIEISTELPHLSEDAGANNGLREDLEMIDRFSEADENDYNDCSESNLEAKSSEDIEWISIDPLVIIDGSFPLDTLLLHIYMATVLVEFLEQDIAYASDGKSLITPYYSDSLSSYIGSRKRFIDDAKKLKTRILSFAISLLPANNYDAHGKLDGFAKEYDNLLDQDFAKILKTPELFNEYKLCVQANIQNNFSELMKKLEFHINHPEAARADEGILELLEDICSYYDALIGEGPATNIVAQNDFENFLAQYDKIVKLQGQSAQALLNSNENLGLNVGIEEPQKAIDSADQDQKNVKSIAEPSLSDYELIKSHFDSEYAALEFLRNLKEYVVPLWNAPVTDLCVTDFDEEVFPASNDIDSFNIIDFTVPMNAHGRADDIRGSDFLGGATSENGQTFSDAGLKNSQIES